MKNVCMFQCSFILKNFIYLEGRESPRVRDSGLLSIGLLLRCLQRLALAQAKGRARDSVQIPHAGRRDTGI